MLLSEGEFYVAPLEDCWRSAVNDDNDAGKTLNRSRINDGHEEEYEEFLKEKNAAAWHSPERGTVQTEAVAADWE